MAKLSKSDAQQLKDSVAKAQDALDEVLAKPYKFATWVTNICLGFLAFFVALLLQMKSSDHKINIGSSMVFTVLVLIPISIGFILRIKWVIRETYHAFTEMGKNLNSMIKTFFETVLEEGSFDPSEFVIKDSDMKVEKIEKWHKKPPLMTIYWQSAFMVGSFLVLAIILINYLF